MKTETLFEEETKKNFWSRVWEEITDFFEYTIWDNLKTTWYNLEWFFHNLKVFWKTLWNYRDWDYEYLIDVNTVCLTQLANRIERGDEDPRSASKKVEKIRELVTLLNRDIEDEFLTKYEKQIEKGEMTYQQVFDEAEIEKRKNAKAMFRIVLGQDPEKFRKKYDEALEKHAKENPEFGKDNFYEVWSQLFDGTGIESWWE